MTHDTRLKRLEALAEDAAVDLHAWEDLIDLATEIGADVAGMRTLVDRYADSPNGDLVAAVGIGLWRPPYQWSEDEQRANGQQFAWLAFAYLRGACRHSYARTLEACAGVLRVGFMLHLLEASTDDDYEALGEFIIRCLEHDNLNVIADGLGILGRLEFRGLVDKALPPGAVADLRGRVRHLAETQADEFDSDLKHLKAFLQPPGSR